MDIRKIQKELVAKNVLPERVLSDQDTKAFSDKAFTLAVSQLPGKGYEVLFTDKTRCVKTIRKKLQGNVSEDERLTYATTLCILGEKDLLPEVMKAVRSYPAWDDGWHYTASAQFGECLSKLDSLIMAIGNTKELSAFPTIIEKAELLQLEDYFSHYRAVCEAFEMIGSREAVPVLKKLITTEGMRFHDIQSYKAAQMQVVPYIHDITYRNRIMKELFLAKSLFICGDDEHIAEDVLKRYALGLEGHYARFAQEVLLLKQS